jgi:hypothetical protein
MVVALDAIGFGTARVLTNAGRNTGWSIRSSHVGGLLYNQ